jgi:hypothetical protein
MKGRKGPESNVTPAVLYHVTRTASVSKIRKKGILPMQASNWVLAGSGKRYGSGEVFAFEAVEDAILWAAKWDWILSKTLGSGEVSIIEFFATPVDLETMGIFEKAGGWKVDDADPVSQASSKGHWLKSMMAVSPAQIIGVTAVTLDHIREKRL